MWIWMHLFYCCALCLNMISFFFAIILNHSAYFTVISKNAWNAYNMFISFKIIYYLLILFIRCFSFLSFQIFFFFNIFILRTGLGNVDCHFISNYCYCCRFCFCRWLYYVENIDKWRWLKYNSSFSVFYFLSSLSYYILFI